jgi:hypothetical protein
MIKFSYQISDVGWEITGNVVVKDDELPEFLAKAVLKVVGHTSLSSINVTTLRMQLNQSRETQQTLATATYEQYDRWMTASLRFYHAKQRQLILEDKLLNQASQVPAVEGKENVILLNTSRNTAPNTWTWWYRILSYFHVWSTISLVYSAIVHELKSIGRGWDWDPVFGKRSGHVQVEEYSIIWWSPSGSAVIEELVNCFPMMWYIIAFIDWLVHYRCVDSIKVWNFHRDNQIAYPGFSGFKSRLRAHWEANRARRRPEAEIFVHELERGNLIPSWPVYANGSTSLGNNVLVSDTRNDGKIVVLPSQPLPGVLLPKIPYDLRNLPFGHTDNLVGRLDTKLYPGTHPILVAHSNVRRSTNSLDNHMAAVLLRVDDIPNSVCDEEAFQLLMSIVPDGVWDQTTVDDQKWFDTRKPKQQKIIKRFQDLEKNNIYFPKDTAVCAKVEDLPYTDKIVTRVFFSVHPYYLYKLGPFTDSYGKFLMSHFTNECVPFVFLDDYPVAAYMAKGATTGDLNHFVARAFDSPPGIYIMVAGDDTWILDSRDGILVIETDYTKFDRTQSYRLQDLWYHSMKKYGAEYYVSIYKRMYAERRVAKNYRLGFKHVLSPKGEYMMSGETSTTERNCFTNIMVSAWAVALRDETFYQQCGLLVKRKTFLSPTGSTFLRHVLLQTNDNTWEFSRLPSYILKFGKSSTDPLSLFAKEWSPDRKLRQFLFSNHLGYGSMQNNWWYVLIDQQIRRITHGSQILELPTDNYKIVASPGGRWVQDDTWNAFMWSRYRVSEQEMLSYVDALKNVEQLPCVMFHSIFDKLCHSDY